MTKTKLLLNSLFLSCLFFVVSLFFTISADAAPRLYFNPSSITPQNGADIQVDILIDVESNATFGADATISIPSEITIKSVTNGQFFDTFSNAPVTNGQLELHGYLSAAFATKTGSGTFAHLTLTSSKTLGTSQVGFVCSTGGTDTEILNASGQNILNCSSLNSLTLTYSTSTPTPTPTGNNTNTTNGCGGTCGSNNNCNNGLFCFQGFCRNPSCQSDRSCECKATPSPSPTPKPKVTAKPSVSSTPIVVTLTKYTPLPSVNPNETNIPTENLANNMGSIVNSPVFWVIIVVLGIVIFFILIKILGRKKGTQSRFLSRPPQL